MKCAGCGCTDADACPGDCWWSGPNICSACWQLHNRVVSQIDANKAKSIAASKKHRAEPRA